MIEYEVELTPLLILCPKICWRVVGELSHWRDRILEGLIQYSKINDKAFWSVLSHRGSVATSFWEKL